MIKKFLKNKENSHIHGVNHRKDQTIPYTSKAFNQIPIILIKFLNNIKKLILRTTKQHDGKFDNYY